MTVRYPAAWGDSAAETVRVSPVSWGCRGEAEASVQGAGEDEGILRQVLQVPLHDLQDDRVRLEGVHGPQVVGGWDRENTAWPKLSASRLWRVLPKESRNMRRFPFVPALVVSMRRSSTSRMGVAYSKARSWEKCHWSSSSSEAGVEHDVQIPLVVFLVIPLPLEHVPGPPQVGEEGVVGQGGALVGPVGVPLVVQVLLLLGEGRN